MAYFYKQLFESNSWLIFFLFITVSFLLNFVDDKFVTTDLLYGQYLEGISHQKYGKYDEFVADFEDDLNQLDLDDEELLDWDTILIDLGFIVGKFILSVPAVAGILMLGFLFEKKYEEIRFPEVLKITMLANFVFLLPMLISVFWFSVVRTDYTFQDLQTFNPFYLIGFLEKDTLPLWSIGSLYLINIYEVIFILMVTYGFFLRYSFSFRDILGKVSLSYIGGLVVWEIVWIYIRSTFG